MKHKYTEYVHIAPYASGYIAQGVEFDLFLYVVALYYNYYLY